MLPDIQNIDDFRERMIDYMVRAVTGMRSYEPDEIHLVNAKKLALEKYQTWEWNYAYGPEYHFRNRFRFNGEDHVCHFRIKDGIIVESRIEGSPALTGVAERLKGCRHMPADISETIAKERSELCNLDIFSFF
jgi:lipoate-protein ligase A